MPERDVIVVDPMLATGNSAIAALNRLKEVGVTIPGGPSVTPGRGRLGPPPFRVCSPAGDLMPASMSASLPRATEILHAKRRHVPLADISPSFSVSHSTLPAGVRARIARCPVPNARCGLDRSKPYCETAELVAVRAT